MRKRIRAVRIKLLLARIEKMHVQITMALDKRDRLMATLIYLQSLA